MSEIKPKPKPYFLVATGSFAPAGLYDNLVEAMKARDYELRAIHLETVGLGPQQGRDTEPATMYDDAALIAREIEALADAGREVILVAHSYGGMPATESTKGLSVQERKKAGKKGGLVRLAYKTVLLTSPGHAAIEVLASMPAEEKPGLEVDEKGWMHQVDPEFSARQCFSDVSLEEAIEWNKKFALHSAVSFTNKLTHAGYRDVPVSYLVCEKDVIIPPEIQRQEIALIERETGAKVDVASIEGGHCPTVSPPLLEEVADWLVKTAEKVEL